MKDKPQGYAHLTAKIDELERELAEAVAKERERCAKIVEQYSGAELLNIWLRAGSKNQKG